MNVTDYSILTLSNSSWKTYGYHIQCQNAPVRTVNYHDLKVYNHMHDSLWSMYNVYAMTACININYYTFIAITVECKLITSEDAVYNYYKFFYHVLFCLHMLGSEI